MGIWTAVKRSWEEEQRRWPDRPWLWKLYLFIAVSPLLSLWRTYDDDLWIAGTSLLLVVSAVTIAALAYRARRQR